MHIKKNMKRDIGIFRQWMSGLTQVEIGKQHGITNERVRQIVASIGRRCYGHVIQNKLPTPPHWNDRNYRNNKEYWLGILQLCEESLSLLRHGTLDTPLRATGMRQPLWTAMKRINVITVGDLRARIETDRTEILRLYRGNVREVTELSAWIEKYIGEPNA